MQKFFWCLLAFGLAGSRIHAQDVSAQDTSGRCAMPDSIAVVGNSRVDDATIRGTAALLPRTQLNYRDVQRAIRALFATGQFEDVQVACASTPAGGSATLAIRVKERPVLKSSTVTGVSRVSPKDVKERLQLSVGAPLDPAKVSRAITRADSLYASKGYYLARVRVDSTRTNGDIALTFRVDEGNRLAISGVRVMGNRKVPTSAIVGAMQTKPEGFPWFRKGEFDDTKFAGDLTERIPQLYGSRGYLDFRVLKDTLIVDRSRGKAEIQLTVSEGPRYTIGSFEILGNKRFSTEELRRFYPFNDDGRTITQSALGVVKRSYHNPPNTFDQTRWEAATDKVNEAYANEGYIYERLQPVTERVPGNDSVRTVNLRWEIDERSPAIVNRIEIVGNDYTYESCIREQIVMAPGQVFKRDYLLRSYQGIGNLNFFETPLPAPDTRPSGDQGDVDVIFRVKEKRTGNVNFGASAGAATGVGGFLGFDQPNLFGRCKRAQLQMQFGRYQKDVNFTYSDPNIRQTRISGSVTAYNTRSRYLIANLGQNRRTGGQLQFGFPVPRSYFSRLFVSYGGERVAYSGGAQTLLGSLATTCNNCFRSTLGFTGQHDTRFGLPFATQGGLQTFTAQFNGGPLGGSAAFQRYTTELRSYAPLAYIGGNTPGSQPLTFVLGLSARAGSVLGNPGPFFSTQSFALGGTQFGEALRGYCEFSVTPGGYRPGACDSSATRQSFGNAFFVGTAEIGLRVNQSLYGNVFFEGGNVWNRPAEFDPTRLFRSVGFGVSVVSPLGPIGLDLGYGLDRVDAFGRRTPGWKLHFKLGQLY